MKTFRQLPAAALLATLLALPALAGDIQIPPSTSPEPPPPSADCMTGTPPYAGVESRQAEALKHFGEIGLSLLQSVLSLF